VKGLDWDREKRNGAARSVGGCHSKKGGFLPEREKREKIRRNAGRRELCRSERKRALTKSRGEEPGKGATEGGVFGGFTGTTDIKWQVGNRDLTPERERQGNFSYFSVKGKKAITRKGGGPAKEQSLES